MFRPRTLSLACSAVVIIGLCGSRTANAEERGAFGAELGVGLGFTPHTVTMSVQHDTIFRAGLSLWYRPIPALSFGISASRSGTSNNLDNGNYSADAIISKGSFYEAFADGRLFPSSIVGAFGRVSAGVARLTLVPGFPESGPRLPNAERTEPVLELEAGPELRLFFAPPDSRSRSALFLRVRGTVTTMPDATFLGLGLALGFEG